MAIELAPLNGVSKDDCEETCLSEPPSRPNNRKKTSRTHIANCRSLWLDTWLFEGIALSFSVACFIAIFGVLVAYDNKERPQIVYKITLNTIVSLLATGCKSSLALVIGEAICQLKWLWFNDFKQRQLFGIQTFESASRGPLGSLMIIVHHRGCSLASLGALVVVLLLAFDPFMQQVLDYPLRSVPDYNDAKGAVAPQLLSYNPSWFSIRTEEAVSRGIWSNEEFVVPPTCSSGNCTWDTFPSAGICSRCVNMTTIAVLNCSLPDITKTFNKTCRIVLPHEPEYQDSDPDLAMFSAFTISNSKGTGNTMEFSIPNAILWSRFDISQWFGGPGTYAGVGLPIAAYAYAEIEMREDPAKPNRSISESVHFRTVTECSLSVCLRDYNISTTNGHHSIQTSNIDWGTTYPLGEDLCWQPKNPHEIPNQPMLNFTSCDGPLDFLTTTVGNLPPRADYLSTYSYDMASHTYGSQSVFVPDAGALLNRLSDIGLEEAMKSVAASLTKLGLENTNHSINGTVHVTQVFVSVQWTWLTLPSILVLVGAIFLGITIVVNGRRQLPLWKSSALAPFYHGLERVENEEYTTTSTMEAKSEVTRVQLQHSEKHMRLMLRQHEWSDSSLSRHHTI